MPTVSSWQNAPTVRPCSWGQFPTTCGGWLKAIDADDVLDGYVSLEAARRDYRVVINPATMTVDTEGTAALRLEDVN